MGNDRFWKAIAVVALCTLFANAYVYFRLNRYKSYAEGWVFDKWTGEICNPFKSNN